MNPLLLQVNQIGKLLFLGILVIFSASFVYGRSCYSGASSHHRGHHYRGHRGVHFGYHRGYKHRSHRYHHRRHHHRHSKYKYYYPKRYYSSSNYYYRNRRPYTSRHRSYDSSHYIDDGHEDYSAQYKNDTSREQSISYKRKTESSPWADIVNNKPRTALRTFGRLASQSPKNGMHKVGYALAAGLQGDYKRAEWAMRRAFRVDPYGVKFITKNERLNYKVMELGDQYSQFVASSTNTPNVNFMHAAVSYLQKDFDTAKSAITKAIDQGDDSKSTHNLFALIQGKSEKYN